MAEEPEPKGAPSEDIVGQLEGESWSALLRTEDYWAIWLGFILIAIAMVIYLPRPPAGMRATIDKSNAIMAEQAEAAPYRTIEWHNANEAKCKLKATSESYAGTIAAWLSHPHGWKTNPLDAFVMSDSQAAAKRDKAQAKLAEAKAKTASALATATVADQSAKAANYENAELNAKAKSLVGAWRDAKTLESSAKKKVKSAKAYNQVPYLIGLCVALAILFGIGMKAMGYSFGKFLIAFPFVFALAVVAYLLAGQSTMKEYGIGYAAWAILIGLIISNTIGTPNWVKSAVQTEYFIKTGLVLLGCEILFGKIVQIGLPGIFVAWVVTPVVLVATYIFGQRILRVPSRTLNVTISSAVSVCGVSAAIATAAACKAKKEELTLAVGLSLVFTSLMMIFMPQAINAMGMDHVLGGAWMGGTIDATGAVAAAGAFLGERALHVSATIKMIQNVLIGLVAFCVALYWCARIERTEGTSISVMEIWYRFPKFVIGFVVASIVMSVFYSSLGSDVAYALIDNGVIRGFTKSFRGWFFCLAFVSIGLATDFRELKQYFAGGKTLILYICGQSFNLVLTLVVAYLMFVVVFREIAAKI
jgi:uncharacterized membrane protein YadS